MCTPRVLEVGVYALQGCYLLLGASDAYDQAIVPYIGMREGLIVHGKRIRETPDAVQLNSYQQSKQPMC